MSKAQKWIALFLCVCFVAAAAFSVVTFASHTDHECSGEHCEICLQINHLRNTLKQFCAAVSTIAPMLAAGCAAIAAAKSGALGQLSTLISLKVQLNH